MPTVGVGQPGSATRQAPGIWPLVLFTGMAWGGSGLLAKGLIDGGVDSFAVTGIPFLIGALPAFAAALAQRELRRTAIGPAMLLGMVGSVPALLFNIAYETLSAGIVMLVVSLAPVFTAVAAHFVFPDERFHIDKAVGLGLAVVGVMVLALAPGGTNRPSIHGLLFVLAGTLVAGLSAIWGRSFAVRHGARAMLAPQLLAAGVLPFLVAAPLGRSLVPEGGYGGREIAVLVLIGVVGSYGGVRSIMTANQTGTTGQVSVVGYVIPVIGVVGGVIFFGDQITTSLIAGGALILAGVAVVGRASSSAARIARGPG